MCGGPSDEEVPMPDITLNRRQVLAGAALAGGVAVLAGPAAPAVADTGAPFLLGVASGDPLPTSVILWTRLARDPYDAHSLTRPVPVEWQVATDERFRHPVREGRVLAPPELAHSGPLDARGPPPRRAYFSRVRPLRQASPRGPTPHP